MTRPLSLAALALSGALAGCTTLDPLTREGLWHPSGANEANLAAMVADPADLVRGKDYEGTDGQMAAAAVARLRVNRVKQLPDSNIAKIAAQTSPTADTGGAVPTAGTAGGGTP